MLDVIVKWFVLLDEGFNNSELNFCIGMSFSSVAKVQMKCTVFIIGTNFDLKQ